MTNEKDPAIVGRVESEMQSLMNIEGKDLDYELDRLLAIKYDVKDKTINDSSVKNITANITLPVISIENFELEEINQIISSKYTELFNTIKSESNNMANKYKYVVSYNAYDNVVEDKRILSVTIYDRIVDIQSNKNSTEKITTYNIDFDSKEQIKQASVILDYFGADCKEKIQTKIKDYLVEKNMIKETEYNYTYTGLENFYLKNNEFHIVFNQGDLVDEKYGILDIIIN